MRGWNYSEECGMLQVTQGLEKAALISITAFTNTVRSFSLIKTATCIFLVLSSWKKGKLNSWGFLCICTAACVFYSNHTFHVWAVFTQKQVSLIVECACWVKPLTASVFRTEKKQNNFWWLFFQRGFSLQFALSMQYRGRMQVQPWRCIPNICTSVDFPNAISP